MQQSVDQPLEAVVPEHAGRWLGLTAACALLVVLAVVAEVVAGSYANSPAPGWESIMPLSWPQAARVAWWLAVASAAGGFRYGLHRLGIRQRPLVVVLSVAPFALFALGIATGSSWTTWH